jgi:hypothetical protein
LLLPDVKVFVVSQGLNLQSMRRSGPVDSRSEVGKPNSTHIGKWNFHSGTWSQHLQFLNNPKNEIMVFAAASPIKGIDIDSPIFQVRLAIIFWSAHHYPYLLI